MNTNILIHVQGVEVKATSYIDLVGVLRNRWGGEAMATLRKEAMKAAGFPKTRVSEIEMLVSQPVAVWSEICSRREGFKAALLRARHGAAWHWQDKV